jgi:hypothetical protein
VQQDSWAAEQQVSRAAGQLGSKKKKKETPTRQGRNTKKSINQNCTRDPGQQGSNKKKHEETNTRKKKVVAVNIQDRQDRTDRAGEDRQTDRTGRQAGKVLVKV